MLKKVKSLFHELNGIEHTKMLAQKYIQKALPKIDAVKTRNIKNFYLAGLIL